MSNNNSQYHIPEYFVKKSRMMPAKCPYLSDGYDDNTTCDEDHIPTFKVKKITNNAVVPFRISSSSAAYYLSCAVELKIPPRAKALIPISLYFALPQGTYAHIVPISDLAWKHSIGVGAGVVDADYRGYIGVVLFNHSDADFEVKLGDRIAQLIVQEIIPPQVKNSEILEPIAKIPKLSKNANRLSKNVVMPLRGSSGYYLSSAVETKVPAKGKALIATDFSIAVPQGTYARIAPVTRLAWKHPIDVWAGAVDADYQGPVGVVLFNHSGADFKVKVGDQIAQLIIEKIITPEVIEEVEDLDATVSGNDHQFPTFKVKKLTNNAVLPYRGSSSAAGYYLSSAVETKVPAKGKALVATDLSIAVPQGTYARIAPTSGAWEHSIEVGSRMVDTDYRGPVEVILFNHSDDDFEVKVGDRIAQLIIQKIITPEVRDSALGCKCERCRWL